MVGIVVAVVVAVVVIAVVVMEDIGMVVMLMKMKSYLVILKWLTLCFSR